MLGFIQTAGPGTAPRRATPPRRGKILAVVVLAGGAALAAIVTQSQQVKLTTRSEPAGIVADEKFHTAGSTVIVSAPPQSQAGYRFSYWMLGGVRQVDAAGSSLAAFSFKILQNEEAVAIYTPEGRDTKGDGIPDWYRLYHYGHLDAAATSDTDEDGLDLRGEFLKGSNPRIRDTAKDGGIVEGGVSRRRGALIAAVVGADRVLYSESSTPAGVLERRQFVVKGSKVTTSVAPEEWSGYRFTEWRVNEVRQENPATKVALGQVTFEIQNDSTAVARYVAANLDTKKDGVPDWFRLYHYGNLDAAADSDTDNDGRTLLEEFRAGTQPRIADSAKSGWIVEGGVSRRRGALLAFDKNGTHARYTESSQPAGVVARDVYLPLQSEVTTTTAPPEINGFRFTEWRINGQRREAAAGFALSSVKFTLAGDTIAVANYVSGSVDTKNDGVPDWFRLYHYGNLDAAADSDTDNDGRTLLEEFRAGTQPRIADNAAAGGVVEGGISRRRGAALVVNLQFFRPERRLLQPDNVIREDFFGDPFNGVAGSFRVGNGGVSAPALGDFDGDGDLDLLVGGANGVLQIFENTGSPLAAVFANRPALSLPGLPSGKIYPALGDWDGDGKADLAVGSDDGIIRFYRSAGFASAPVAAGSLDLGTADPVQPAFLPAAAGKLDLLVLRGDGAVSRFAYTGNAVAPYALPAQSASVLPDLVVNGRSLAVADANGDGRPDILASDADGRIWFFRAEASGGYFLNSKVWGGSYAGFVSDLRVTVADIDGNGSPDIIGGAADGSLVFLRNPARSLRIDPPLSTMVTGDSATFTSVDDDGTLRWAFARNSTGGTIDPLTGAYVAGSKAGVDGIFVRSASGMTGVAWVNVISPGSAAGLGRAIVVAGRRGPNDPVWPATRSLSRRAYEVLRYRGLKAADITYLSHNRKDIGVDGSPTRAEFLAALSAANGAPKLLLYLVDHGRLAPGGNDGLFLLGRNEQFSGTELKQWLDQYQQSNPATEVIVIIECCYADSLGAKLREGNPPRRAVYASVAAKEIAHMAAGGAVSYSSMLWSDLSLGRTLSTAHEAARIAMQRFQNAQAWDPGLLGDKPLGLADVSSASRPSLGYANPPQRLMGTSIARLWVGDVASSFPIERVWAVVVPPGYAPSGDAPVVDLPEIELIRDPTTGEYEAEFGGFTEGNEDEPYTIIFHARDLWGQISPPVVTTVTQTALLNRVVMVSHGYAGDDEARARSSQLAEAAVDTARLRRVRPANLRVFAEDEGVKLAGVSSKEALRQALLEWPLPDGKTLNNLSVYLVGEADKVGLRFSNGDLLTPAEFSSWVTALQQATGCTVNVIVDSDYSGSFLPALANPSLGRVVMASTAADQPNGYTSEWAGFSRWFWHAIGKGQNLRASYSFAGDLARLVGEDAPYLFDDNGDGRFDRTLDGSRAEKSYIGAAFVTAADPPYIGRASAPLVVSKNQKIHFWAADVVMPDGEEPRLVWAEIVAPDGSLEDPVELLWNNAYQHYDAFLPGFATEGRYMALVYAGDPDDPRSVSNPVPVQIFVGQGPPPGSSGGQSAGLTLPLTGQVFDARIDGSSKFETKLEAEPGQRITIEVFGVTAGRDVKLELIAPDGDEEEISDEWGGGFGERIWSWEPTAKGTYRVRVSASSGPVEFGLRAFMLLDSLDFAGRLPQSIDFQPPAEVTRTPWGYKLRASSSSQLNVEFELVGGEGRIVDGMLIADKAGSVQVRARQDGDSRYIPAFPVVRTINFVEKAEPYEAWARRHFSGGASGVGAPDNDADGDGLTNLEEYYAETDPNKRDTDGDGLSDKDEVMTHRTDPLKKDSDGDGHDDGKEITQRTNPLDANSYPRRAPTGLFVGNFMASGTATAEAFLANSGQISLNLTSRHFTGRILIDGRWHSLGRHSIKLLEGDDSGPIAVSLKGGRKLQMTLAVRESEGGGKRLRVVLRDVKGSSLQPIATFDAFAPVPLPAAKRWQINTLLANGQNAVGGYATARVDTKGSSLRVVAVLGDGSKATMSTRLFAGVSPDAQALAPAALVLKKPFGIMVGNFGLDTASSEDGHLFGTLFGASEDSAEVTSLSLTGHRWQALASKAPFYGTDSNAVSSFSLRVVDDQARALDGHDFSGVWRAQRPPVFDVQTKGLRISVNRKTGAISGTIPFTEVGAKTKSVKYLGVLSSDSFVVGPADQPRQLKGVGILQTKGVFRAVELTLEGDGAE